MGTVNEVRLTPLGTTADGYIEGVVRVRGFSGSAAGRSFGFQRYQPEAVVVRREDDVRRLPIEATSSSLPRMALPVAVYLAARLLIGRRR